MVRYKERCFRCKASTRKGLYIKIGKRERRSVVGSLTHPLCSTCAISFWRWADQANTLIAYEAVQSMKARLRDRARELNRREAAVRRRERRLEISNDEVVARVT